MNEQAGMVVGSVSSDDEESASGSEVGKRPKTDALGVEAALELSDGTVADASRIS
jgi:hypothetical protein